MKLVIIGLVVAAAIAIGSFFGGWSFAQKSQEVTELKTQMHKEHVELAHKLDAFWDEDGSDGQETRYLG